MSSLQEIFSLVCGQQHNWLLGGAVLPFCQRCTGLYVGAVLAFAALVLFRPKPTTPVLWAHGVFLLQMIPFGYHLIAQSAHLRAVTGQLFATGLVYYLMLLPGDFWARRRDPVLQRASGYWVVTIGAIFGLLAATNWGGLLANTVLSWVGFVGLLLYLALVLLNLTLLAVTVRAFLRRRPTSPAT